MTHIKKLVMQGFKSFVKKTDIPFTQGINVVLGPNGSGKCLTGDSVITLGNGVSERIDSLVNSRIKNSVKTEDGFLIPGDGLEVLSLNLKTLKTEKAKIKSFVKRTSPKKMLHIKSRSGRSIKATKYHPLFILKNNEVVEARADELKKGVRIAVPRKIDFIPESKYMIELINSIKEEDRIYIPYREEYKLILKSIKSDFTWKQLAEKIGISHYVIKGLLNGQSINFSHLVKIMKFTDLSDLEIVKLIGELISNGKKTKFNFENSEEFSRFFGYLLAEGRLSNSSQIWFTNGTKEIINDYVSLVKNLFNKDPLVREYKPNCWDVIIFSEPLKKILSKLGMASNTGNKKISNIILKHSSNRDISALLNGLYCGDGYISPNSIEITTKSKELAKGIETCLLRLGILFSTKDVTKEIKSKEFSGKYKTTTITGVNNFKIFNENISLIHPIKRQKVLSYLNKKSNPNVDLIELNSLVKEIVGELGINVKKTKKDFPILDAYCYNQCTPSRNGLALLSKGLFSENLESINKLNNFINSDIFWDEITGIEEIDGEEWVYDLCVDEHRNFIANNIFAHNSNISDALCFVLGRLSIKSMRAAKAKNLIFLGSKTASPAREASVEIVFDNKEKVFSIDDKEISIKRIVRRNGQSIYKINGNTKTRQEVLALLAQGGIDPNGFNIILQGEIQNFVRMMPEERRKIIEEVSGISVYESRKQKSLKELSKTEDKLKEVLAILRERTAYLNNLEKERQQALKYKRLESDIKKYKASIVYQDLCKRKKSLENLNQEIEKKNKEIEKIKSINLKVQTTISSLESKIEEINSTIQKSTGLEQEKLNQEINNLRAELAGLGVKHDNLERKFVEVQKQKQDLQESIRNNEVSLKEIQKSLNTTVSKKGKEKELSEKKKELEILEEERKKFYMTKTELKSILERIRDKKTVLENFKTESNFLLKQIEQLTLELFDKNMQTNSGKLDSLKHSLAEKKEQRLTLNKREIELEKQVHINEYEIDKNNKLVEKISKMDVCPVCKNKITKDHVHGIHKEVKPKIENLKKQVHDSDKEFSELYNKRDLLDRDIEQIQEEITKRDSDLIRLSNINGKKDQIKSLHSRIDQARREILEIEKRKSFLEKNFDDNSTIEQKYESLRLEVQEVSMRSDENLDSEVSFKTRELERAKISLKQLLRDEEDLKEDLSDLKNTLEEKETLLEDKRDQEESLSRRFNKLIQERDGNHRKIRELEFQFSSKQNNIHNIEQEINNLKIDQARINAEIENLETEMLAYPNTEIIKANKETLLDKLGRAQEIISKIGSVNLRSLEVYDEIKKEYDSIKEKVEIIEKEKEGVLKVIKEIDIRKKKAFLKTIYELNDVFSRNFSQLSTKGQVTLELENKKDPFEGGVNIIVKTGHGKYFDVKSLSGGEQTLVALSLIFAIQEFSPYYFYILDEIDAALDKRNSERLAGLLRKYMQKGQYIVITHNDEIITNATNLYGVSMHDGISKVVSLKI